MKSIKIFVASLVMIATVACTNGTGSKSVNNKITRAEIDSVSYLVGINFGSFVKGYDLGDLNFSEIEKGIHDFINAKGTPSDSNFVKQFKISPELMNRILSGFIAKRKEITKEINQKAETEFFDKIKKQNGIKATESGLCYEIINEGKGDKVGEKDTVFVHYKGTLKDGSVFDQVKADAPSVRMVLGQVIKGWSEGLQLIGEGGNIKLYIPSSLGYGAEGAPRGGIAPYSPLVFEVQVDSVKRYVVPVAKEASAKK